eukprot:2010593-Amphidinium_carterae.1
MVARRHQSTPPSALVNPYAKRGSCRWPLASRASGKAACCEMRWCPRTAIRGRQGRARAVHHAL